MRKREMSTTRRGALGLAALVLLIVPMFVAAAATRTDGADPPKTAAIEQEARESDRLSSAGLLVLGFGLAITAHTLKRRNS